MMNKKGNIFMGVFIGLFLFISGILVLPFITDDIDTARVAVDCSDTTINDGAKLFCLAIDGLVPYFLWFLFTMTIGYLVGR